MIVGPSCWPSAWALAAPSDPIVAGGGCHVSLGGDGCNGREDGNMMAKQMLITDDLDGSSSAETVEFSFDGVSYSIDLAKKNRTALDRVFKPWIAAATPVTSRGPGGRPRSGSGRRSSRSTRSRSTAAGSGVDLAAVRAWAAEQGIEVSARGRVAQSVIDAYQAAH